MPLTKDEFAQACLAICPHCRADRPVRKRSNGEWQHTWDEAGRISVSICWANGLRCSETLVEQ